MDIQSITVTQWSQSAANQGSPNCLENISRKNLQMNGNANPTMKQIYDNFPNVVQQNNDYVDQQRLASGGNVDTNWKPGMDPSKRVTGGKYPDGGQYINPNVNDPDPGKRYIVRDGDGPNGKPYVIYVGDAGSGGGGNAVDPKTGDPTFPGLKAKVIDDTNPNIPKYNTSTAGSAYDKFKTDFNGKNPKAGEELVAFCTKVPGWGNMTAEQQAAIIAKYGAVGLDDKGQQKTAAIADFNEFLTNIKPGDYIDSSTHQPDAKAFQLVIDNYPGMDNQQNKNYTTFVKSDYFKNAGSGYKEGLLKAAAKDPANAVVISNIKDGKIPPGAKLYPGQYIITPKGGAYIQMTAEGNLEVYKKGADGKYALVWESGTKKGANGQGAYAIFEAHSGNFVVFSDQNDDQGHPKILFETKTTDKTAVVMLSEDGKLTVQKDATELWNVDKGGIKH